MHVVYITPHALNFVGLNFHGLQICSIFMDVFADAENKLIYVVDHLAPGNLCN